MNVRQTDNEVYRDFPCVTAQRDKTTVKKLTSVGENINNVMSSWPWGLLSY